MTRLDERAAQATADEIERQFSDVGGRAGTAGATALGNTFSAGLAGSARGAASTFMSGFTSGISSEVGRVSGALSGITRAATSMGGGVAAAGAIAAAGIAGIAVAAVQVGQELYNVGARFDAIADGIAVRTGKIGDDLDALTASINNVASDTASSIEDVADIGARVSQSLDLSGRPLEDLTKKIADLNRMTGESLSVRDLGMALRGFGQDGAVASQALDAMYQVSTRTAIPVGELVGTLRNVGPAARSLGLDINETTALIASFEKAGIDADRTVAGLNRAAATFADNGINMQTGLADTITQIRGFIDAGRDAEAIDLAGKVFGTRSAQLFVDAIRQGKLDVQSLHQEIGNSGPTIEQMDQKTADWSESWNKLNNQIQISIDKIGGPLFDAINNLAVKTADAITELLKYTFDKPEFPQFDRSTDQPGLGPLLNPADTQPAPVDATGLPPFLQPPTAPQPGVGQPPPPGGYTVNPLEGVPSNASTPAPPQDIAGILDRNQGGSKLPQAPQVPYPAEYGQPPQPGETPEHWRQRMAVIEAEHDVAEKKARVEQLAALNNDADQQNNVDQNEIVKANNDLIQAKQRQTETEARLRDAERQAVQVPYPAGYGAPPRPGETADQYSREQSYYEAVHKRQQAEAELQQLQASGVATAEDVAKANNELNKARADEYQAQLRLNEQSNKLSDALDDVGAKLDPDLGISKGLAGIADNLVRFLASLAAAPMLGQMSVISALGGGKDAGSGLMGVLAAQGAFGPQYQLGTQGMPGVGAIGSPSISSLGPIALQPGTYPGDATLLSRVPPGSYSQTQAADLTQGLGDCASAVEDLVNLLDGRPTAGREMSTGNAAEWLTAHGFLPGSMPGAFNVGFNAGHMQATLPGGTPFNWGSDDAAARRGIGGSGAFDPAFTTHFYRPVGVSSATSAPPAAAYAASPAAASAMNVSTMSVGTMTVGATSTTGAAPTGPASVGAPGGNPRVFGPSMPGSAGVSPTAYPWIPANPSRDQIVQGITAAAKARGIPDNQIPGILAIAQAESNFGQTGFMGFSTQTADTGYTGGAAYANDYNTALNKFLDNYIAGGLAQEGGPQAKANAIAALNAGNPAPFLHWLQYGVQGAVPQGGFNNEFAGNLATAYNTWSASSAPSAGMSAPLNTPSPLSPSSFGPFGPPAGPAPGPTQIGAAVPAPSGIGKGGLGIQQGGLLDMAIQSGLSAGGLAVDAMAPGAGQAAAAAANMGIKLANRAIQYAGQAAGIGVQGLMETFLPTGGSKLAQNNWLTRIVGGLAGAAPALPNLAGKAAQPTPEQVANVDPNTTQHGQGQGQQPGPVIGGDLNVVNNRPTEDGTGRDILHILQNQGPGM